MKALMSSLGIIRCCLYTFSLDILRSLSAR